MAAREPCPRNDEADRTTPPRRFAPTLPLSGEGGRCVCWTEVGLRPSQFSIGSKARRYSPAFPPRAHRVCSARPVRNLPVPRGLHAAHRRRFADRHHSSGRTRRRSCRRPSRRHRRHRALLLTEERGPEAANHLLIWSSWAYGRGVSAKLAAVFPDNERRGRGPTVRTVFVLFDGDDGAPRCVITGDQFTRCRTAADSALASTFLSREDSRVLVVVGAGAQAETHIRFHCACGRRSTAS